MVRERNRERTNLKLLVNMKKINIVLASQSPRRQELLRGMGFEFETVCLDIDESFPKELKAEDIVIYLSRKKANAIVEVDADTLVITADTIVWLGDDVMNKPYNIEESKMMLRMLSGRKHVVYTGVSLKTKEDITTFYDQTDVYFKCLSEEEIEFYVSNYKPFDKAGSYGVQEWIGYVGIDRIDGSFYNVMGLPTAKLYDEIKKII